MIFHVYVFSVKEVYKVGLAIKQKRLAYIIEMQWDKRYKEAKECLYAKHQREMLYLKIKEGTGIMVFPYINIIFFIHYIEMLIDGKVIYTTEGSI